MPLEWLKLPGNGDIQMSPTSDGRSGISVASSKEGCVMVGMMVLIADAMRAAKSRSEALPFTSQQLPKVRHMSISEMPNILSRRPTSLAMLRLMASCCRRGMGPRPLLRTCVCSSAIVPLGKWTRKSGLSRCSKAQSLMSVHSRRNTANCEASISP